MFQTKVQLNYLTDYGLLNSSIETRLIITTLSSLIVKLRYKLLHVESKFER